MSKYTEVIDNYITQWPTASNFVKAHKNYQVVQEPQEQRASWKLGKDYSEGDVFFTFKDELGKRLQIEGVLYLMKDEFGFRRLDMSPASPWTINSSWETTSTSWGLNYLTDVRVVPFIIVIPFKNILRGSGLLNWNKLPWGIK